MICGVPVARIRFRGTCLVGIAISATAGGRADLAVEVVVCAGVRATRDLERHRAGGWTLRCTSESYSGVSSVACRKEGDASGVVCAGELEHRTGPQT